MEKEFFNALYNIVGKEQKQKDFELTIKELNKLINKKIKDMSMQELSQMKYLTKNLLNHIDK